MHWGVLFLSAGLLLEANLALANEPVSLRLRQARAILPHIHTYFEVLDNDGQPIKEIQPIQLSATVSEQSATVEKVERFEQTGEGIAYILLVDISKSLTGDQFKQVHTALKDWVLAIAENDRVALMTFGSQVKVVQDFTSDKGRLQEQIESLHPTDDHTQLHQGFLRAMDLANRADKDLPHYRVIVTLSDGKDDYAGGATRQEVLDRMQEDRVPIYALGLRPVFSKTKEKDRQALEALGSFARTSGGEYLEVGSDRLETSYAAMRQRIRQVFVARLSCNECPTDGQTRRLQMSYSAGTRILPDGLSLRLLPQVAAGNPTDAKPLIEDAKTVPLGRVDPTPENKSFSPLWLYGGGVLMLLGLLIGVFRLFHKNERRIKDEELGESFALPRTSTILHTSLHAVKGVPVRLTVIGRNDSAQQYEVDLIDKALIGRSEQDCRVTLPEDWEVSARHCALIREQGDIFVQDLDSKNGTMVNGVPITGKHRLQDDDLISIGRTSLRFSIGRVP